MDGREREMREGGSREIGARGGSIGIGPHISHLSPLYHPIRAPRGEGGDGRQGSDGGGARGEREGEREWIEGGEGRDGGI